MSEQEVYVGVWRDHSNDVLRQLILTVPIIYAGYIISVMTLLVSLAGSRVWYILTFIFHQLRAHPDKRSDPVHAQIQAMLRNSITAGSGLTDALLMCLAWRGTGMHAGRRISPIIFMSFACMVIFTLAGTFVSSAVTQKTPDVIVLAKAPGCGSWEINISAMYESYRFDPNKAKILADDTRDARLYAKWFYADMPPSSVPTSQYPIKKLPYSKKMAPCPFSGQGRCISNDTSSKDTAMVLDTGKLNSHFHLGLNAPEEDRLEIRKVVTCSPINGDDLISVSMNETGGFVNYTGLTNHPNDLVRLNKRSDLLTANGYSVGCSSYTGFAKSSSWAAEPFDRDDADLTLCFVGQESVWYPEPVYDPLFLANGSRVFGEADDQRYLGSNYVNLIGCIDQMQFCNPVTGRCTNVTHPAGAWAESATLDLNEHQKVVLNRTAVLTALTGTASYGLSTLGIGGLQAVDFTSGDVVSTALPPDQWQSEAKLWFETGLSMLQGHILRFLGRIDQSSPHMYGRFLVYTPLSELSDDSLKEAFTNACENQKITTTNRYQNFNFAALMLIMSFSLLIIFISIVLEPIIMLVRQVWATQKGEWRQNEWDTDNKYWLVRVALEAAGVGPWRMGGSAIKLSIPVVDKRASYEQVPPKQEAA